jgi:hypothetical protein
MWDQCNNPNQIADDHVGTRQNPSVVGGQAQVSVLKPGSDTICKAFLFQGLNKKNKNIILLSPTK